MKLLAALAGLALSATAAHAQVAPLTTWYWQLSGSINTTRNDVVYDIDGADNSTDLIQNLKSQGHKVICYFSAGTWEDWRSDAGAFPQAVKGSSNGWPGEQWLDVRSQVVRDLMTKRLDTFKAKSCDGVEPDNVDGYANRSGFPLTAADQISYNSFLADAAHQRGLLVALKNDTDQVKQLVGKFDFAIVEECFRYSECGSYSPFVTAGKAVLAAEYGTFKSARCAKAKALKFSLVFFNKNLNGKTFRPCAQ